MQIFLTLELICCVGILVLFVLYALSTRKTIREQEQEIARLRSQLKREKQRKPLQIVQDGRKPKFGDF